MFFTADNVKTCHRNVSCFTFFISNVAGNKLFPFEDTLTTTQYSFSTSIYAIISPSIFAHIKNCYEKF